VGAGVILAAWPWLVSLLHLSGAASAARWAVMALLLGVLMDGLALPWRGVLEGTQRYTALSWVTAGTGVLGACLAVLAVRTGGGLKELAISVAVTCAVRACLVVAVAHRYVASLTPTLAGVTRDDLRSVGGYGLRVQVTSASGAVNVGARSVHTGGGLRPGRRGRVRPRWPDWSIWPVWCRRTRWSPCSRWLCRERLSSGLIGSTGSTSRPPST